MTTHNQPVSGATCACCWDDISNENYVEYRPYPSAEHSNPNWLPSGFCETCVEHLLKTQYPLWTESLAKSTCLAEQRRLLKRGPPINLRDDKALPCPENGEVDMLWYMRTNEEKIARLEGSLNGEERDRYWQEQIKVYSFDESQEDAEVEEQESQK